jgi:hypothetical protein
VLAATPPAPTPAPFAPSLRDRIGDWFRSPILQFATTAAAVTAIGVSLWQASENTRLRDRLSAASAQQEALRSEMAVLSARAVPPPVGFLLDTRLDRSSTRPRFVIPSASTPVELQLAVDGPPAAAYRIRVETVQGDLIASAQSANPALLLPGGALQPRQEYVVKAEAISASGAATRLRSFTFATAP